MISTLTFFVNARKVPSHPRAVSSERTHMYIAQVVVSNPDPEQTLASYLRNNRTANLRPRHLPTSLYRLIGPHPHSGPHRH